MGMITNKPLKECAPGCALKKRLKVIQRWLIVSSNAVKVQWLLARFVKTVLLWLKNVSFGSGWSIYVRSCCFFFISTLEITRKFNAKIVSKVSGRLWQMSIDGVLRGTENLSGSLKSYLFLVRMKFSHRFVNWYQSKLSL